MGDGNRHSILCLKKSPFLKKSRQAAAATAAAAADAGRNGRVRGFGFLWRGDLADEPGRGALHAPEKIYDGFQRRVKTVKSII